MDVFKLLAFEGLAEIGKNVGIIAEAGAAAVRPLEQIGKSMESAAEMAIEIDGTLPFWARQRDEPRGQLSLKAMRKESEGADPEHGGGFEIRTSW